MHKKVPKVWANIVKKIVMILAAVIGFGFVSANAQNKVTCPKCNGNKKEVQKCPNNCHNGAIFCNSCSGSGEKKSRCSGCDGGYNLRTVQKKCTNCNGSRYFRENQPVTCTACRNGKVPTQSPTRVVTDRNGNKTTVGGEVTYTNCRLCNGTGQRDNYVNVACRSCGGSGYSGTETVREKHSCDYGYVTSKCSTCSGRGSYMCQRCQGYASIQTDCSRCRGAGYVFVYNE